MHALQLPLKRRIRVACRQLFSRRRVLPNFIIIGGMKCGTTSLLHHINQHPQVAPAAVKEVHYFDTQFARGSDWYRAYFPTENRMQRLRERQGVALTGEASPYYIVHPHAARCIAEVVPEVKLIALLRDPVKRAYSHYMHNRRGKHQRAGREPLSFAEAIEQESSRITAEYERMLADESYDSSAFRHYSYVKRGLYQEQLECYLRYFDRTQLLVLRAEELFRDTQKCYDRVLAFLNLQPHAIATSRVRNSGKYAALPDDAFARLREYFAPRNQQLYELLQQDMAW